MAVKPTIQLMAAQASIVLIDSSGQTVFRNYFKTLDNTRVYFDWSTPASWEQEIHIPISGTNYTRLIPYTLQPQSVFDKIVLYNITIPALTGQPHSYRRILWKWHRGFRRNTIQSNRKHLWTWNLLQFQPKWQLIHFQRSIHAQY